jgi:ribonuclease Z
MIVVNMTPDKIWVRDGVIADYSNVAAPKFDIESQGGLVIPPAKHNRADIQQQSIRDAEIPPQKYYPEGYAPEAILEWPTDKPIFIPAEVIKENAKK